MKVLAFTLALSLSTYAYVANAIVMGIGNRIGAFTPTFTFSSFRDTEHKNLSNAIRLTAGDPFTQANIAGLLPGQRKKQDSITSSYSSTPAMAIKAEWQYVNPKGTSG